MTNQIAVFVTNNILKSAPGYSKYLLQPITAVIHTLAYGEMHRLCNHHTINGTFPQKGAS